MGTEHCEGSGEGLQHREAGQGDVRSPWGCAEGLCAVPEQCPALTQPPLAWVGAVPRHGEHKQDQAT